MKHLFLLLGILFFTFACKKDPEVDLCKNGFLDIGETSVDCGGSCPPCPVVYQPNLYLKLNGKPITFQNKTITELNSNWYLNCSNDSIQLQFNLGPDISVGNYNMQQANTFGVVNGVNYNMSTAGYVGIYANDPNAQRVSGLFQTKLYIPGSFDTVFVSSGEFYDLPY